MNICFVLPVWWLKARTLLDQANPLKNYKNNNSCYSIINIRSYKTIKISLKDIKKAKKTKK